MLLERSKPPFPILHFGVGAFHRSHQAWALQQLIDQRPEEFGYWGITGVGILPQDLAFTKALSRQDGFYFVQRFAPEEQQHAQLISTIREMLHVTEDYETILSRIAAPQTKLISFTITEGGYNMDYANNTFIWDAPAVQDLKKEGVPKTIFRVLAEGLKKRMTEHSRPVVLMS